MITKYKEFIKENKSIPLPQDIIDISNQYIKCGKDIFVVGGAVRDFLQGKKPKDYDLVTNALPEESKKILKLFNVSDEQGKNFGVIRVYTKDEPQGYEIASYRKDISGGRDTKGDDIKVEMGNNITLYDDCMRRDLSINSLYYDIKNKQIIDFVNGISDIKNSIIKAVGDPIKRFSEDRLRICRIFRFASRLNGKIDKETSKAIKSDNRLRGINVKEDVSPERIWDEFKKSFYQAKDFTYYLELLNEYDMWDQMFPNIKINKNIKKSNYLECYLSNLFINNKSISFLNKMIQEFRIDTNIARKISFLISLLGLTENDVTELYKKKIVSGVSDDMILDWYKINNINNNIFNAFLIYKPSVSSEDLMKQGYIGIKLGLEIKRLEIEKFKQIVNGVTGIKNL